MFLLYRLKVQVQTEFVSWKLRNKLISSIKLYHDPRVKKFSNDEYSNERHTTISICIAKSYSFKFDRTNRKLQSLQSLIFTLKTEQHWSLTNILYYPNLSKVVSYTITFIKKSSSALFNIILKLHYIKVLHQTRKWKLWAYILLVI